MFYDRRIVLKGRRFYLGSRFRIGHRTYRLFRKDFRCLKEMRKILDAAPNDGEENFSWLLAHRTKIRKILRHEPAEALTLVSISTSDRATVRFALWLRGFQRRNVGAKQLLELARLNDSEIKYRVATTLQKIGAWAQLRELMSEPEMEQFQHSFEIPGVSSVPFEKRMTRFIKNVAKIDNVERICPLYVGEDNPSSGKPAKPKWLIRLVLDRVRMLVSSKHSLDRLPKTGSEENPV